MKIQPQIFLTCLMFISFCAQSQDEQTVSDQVQMSPKLLSKYLDEASGKSHKIEEKLNKETDKALQQLQTLEEKMQKKLKRIDSTKAREIFGNVKEKYESWEEKLKQSKLTHY